MDKEASSSPGFVRTFLISAALILAVTAVGKAIPVHHNDFTLCLERPILGPFQLHATNQAVYELAAVVEFGIVGMICFCRQRWQPCLACSVWGGLCLLVHVVFLGPDALASCNCLGWFQQIIPLPKEVLSTILLFCAGWLALGGLAAFYFSWRRSRFALLLLTLAIGILTGLSLAIRYFEVNSVPIRTYGGATAEPYTRFQVFFYIASAGLIALALGLYLRARQQRRPLS